MRIASLFALPIAFAFAASADAQIPTTPAAAPADATSTTATAATGANVAPAPTLRIEHRRYTLPNGLEVIFAVNRKLPVVAVDVWYHVGAFHEPAGRSGFAHLFEHLMFQGTPHTGDDKHFYYLEQAGASNVNGTTNFDRTNYFEVVPSNELPLALWLESDRMAYLMDGVTQAKLDEQRGVVKNERLQRYDNRPYGLADEALWHALFPPSHPYYGMVIGSLSDLDAATLVDVKDFYNRYYAPANATLVISGDFDEVEAEKLVKQYFSTLPSATKPTTPVVAPPVLEKEVRIDYAEPIGKLARVTVSYLSPPNFAAGDAELDLLAHILTSGASSYLQKALLFDEQLAQSVFAAQRSMGNVSVFQIEALVRPNVDPEKVLAAIDAQLENLHDFPPSSAEVERAKASVETDTLFGLQSVINRAETLQSYNHFMNDADFLAKDLARYQNATPESIVKTALDVLKPTQRVVLVVKPAPAAVPAAKPEGK